MGHVDKSVLVTYSAQQMYELVRDVVAYPSFLPWCGQSSVEVINEHTERASVEIVFKGIKQVFSTLNTHQPFETIHMTLAEGPFKRLEGHWRFLALREDACKVSFQLQYEFESKVLEQLVGPVFDFIANSFVDSFIGRADRLYAQGTGAN